MKQKGWRKALKVTVDRVAAVAGIVALSPVFVAVAAGVWATVGRPVLFRQDRGGYKGRVFKVIKFRTMSDARDAQGRLLPDETRLHPFGAFLRRTSLDELPQLFNLLKGDVSLVGPRPFMARYLTRYSPEQMRRHDVIPGITGWAQVHGRNSISWEEKFALDCWYVDHWNLALDAHILLKTVAVVVRGDGITSGGAAVSAPEFMGTPVPDARG
jgi:lipopolysaccharide/colanic/teichoic acid biosynthesis glycosyltransferase